MHRKNRIVVLFGQVHADARPDEQDVLVEVEQVCGALRTLGYEPISVPLTLDLGSAADRLLELRPTAVFNLVESVDGQDRLLYLATTLLDYLGLAYTGSPSEAMFLSSNKVLAKRLLDRAGIPTPEWAGLEEALADGPGFDPPYLVKSVWDNASQGLERLFPDRDQLLDRLSARTFSTAAHSPRREDVFVESYIEGREFNISVLEGRHGTGNRSKTAVAEGLSRRGIGIDEKEVVAAQNTLGQSHLHELHGHLDFRRAEKSG
ncbi:D-alanine--D-alanine ligase [subsurface metagenome]